MMIMQGKKQKNRIESLAALEKIVRSVLNILGLMPMTYAEVRYEMRNLVHIQLSIG